MIAKSNDEILEELLNNPDYSEEYKLSSIKKYQELDEVVENMKLGYSPAESVALLKGEVLKTGFKDNVSYRASSYILSTKVGFCKQLKNTWCSAATIKQTIHPRNSFFRTTQKEIIDVIGVGPSFDTVVDYVNKNVDSEYSYNLFYIKKASVSDSQYWLLASVSSTISIYDKPVMINMKAKPDDPDNGVWPYKAPDGHFANIYSVSGHNADTCIYGISDPYYYKGYVEGVPTNSQGKHSQPAANVCKVITQHYGYISY